jgi:hypothetical protein
MNAGCGVAGRTQTAAGGRLGSFAANNNYNKQHNGVGVGGNYVVHAPTIITTITVTT